MATYKTKYGLTVTAVVVTTQRQLIVVLLHLQGLLLDVHLLSLHHNMLFYYTKLHATQVLCLE